MKTINFIDKDWKIPGYELDDLEPETRDKVIAEHASFLIQTMAFEDLSENFQKGINRAEKLQTPWFTLSHVLDNAEDEVIDNIRANNYLFDADGELLPVTYHVRNNKIDHVTCRQGKKEFLVTLEDN